MRALGVTLLELMITVAIVAIIAAIAYPGYQGHMRKVRRADAIEHLLSAQLKQEELRVTSGAYTTDFSLLGGATSDHYSYSATVDGLTYTLTATAKSGSPQALDTGCTSLSLNHQDARTPANCWN